MTKEELAIEVIDRLKKEYPLADCTLDYDEAWKLLVSCLPGSTVYRCKSKRCCSGFICKISKRCGPCSCHSRGD